MELSTPTPKSVTVIKYPRLLLQSGFLLLFFLLFGSNYALAVGNAYFPQDTTVQLTIGGTLTDFTIKGESDADTVVVDTSTITVTISPNQTFSIVSPDRKKLTNDSPKEFTCNNTESSLILTFTAQTTVIITPESATACSVGGGGGGGGSVSSTSAPTSTPVSTPTPTPATFTPSPTPIPDQISPAKATAKPEQYNLKDGDVVSAGGSDDPDVYIVNSYGYKRLFLNPVIFKFYGHLGGFSKVKNIVSTTRNIFPTSGLFRNCEANDAKVYGVEVTGEDTGTLHWVNTTGAQAVADDPDFFKKVFCINNNEFAWYKKGTAYTSVNQIPLYSRKSVSQPSPSPTPSTTAASGKIKVVSSVAWLNVRDSNSTSGKVVSKALPNQEFTFVDFKNGWYKIQKDGKDFGWVFGGYVLKL